MLAENALAATISCSSRASTGSPALCARSPSSGTGSKKPFSLAISSRSAAFPDPGALSGFAFHPGGNPFDDRRAFELGEDAKHLHDHPARGTGVSNGLVAERKPTPTSWRSART